MRARLFFRKALFSSSLVLLVLILSLLTLGGCGGKEEGEKKGGTIYVVFKSGVSRGQAEETIALHNCTAIAHESFGSPYYEILVPTNKTEGELIEEFQVEPWVMTVTNDVSAIPLIPPESKYLKGKIEVVFYPYATDEQINELIARHACTIVYKQRSEEYVVLSVQLPEGKNEDEAVEEFLKEPLVKEAYRSPIIVPSS